METRTELNSYMRFKLNLEHPSYEDCYAYGYEASLHERQEAENPYQEGTPQHMQWAEGWWDGFYGEKPLFELLHDDIEVDVNAANDERYKEKKSMFGRVVKITGVIAATAFLGYQAIDLAA